MSETGALWKRIAGELHKVIVGQDRAVHDLGVALLAGGHVLLEGVPGTAKTLLVRALAKALDASFRRIQFTPDLMPADITGVSMWHPGTGGFTFHAPGRVGDAVARTSTIEDVTTKTGRTGTLVFVAVRHELRCNGATAPAIVEHHDIVYREAKKPGDVDPPPQPAETGAPWQRTIVPDDVLLFRYSALTFNGHRIHYDRRYVTEVEGYPGLIVHGPLIATLLVDLVRRERPDARITGFRFKAVRPTFDLHPFRVHGRPSADGKTVALWANDHEGWLTMQGEAVLA